MLLVLAGLAGGALAAPAPAAAAAAAATAAPPAPTSMRLPDTVRPLAARLSLTLDPAQPAHSGEIEIDLELKQPARGLVLHAKELQIRQASVDLGNRRIPALKAVRAVDAERVELRFPQPLPAGRARLAISFAGKPQETDELGLFRRREAGDWYAFTQFESTGARLAFPLFDEPGWKLPWTVVLTVPQALSAFANTMPKHEAAAQPGWKRIEFEPTPPLPSYLLAFAVGPFEVVDAPPAGGLPIRVITPRGRAADAAFAAGVAARIVERLEAYFDLPHPYAKLDSLALTVPGSFGAMENAGLVTYAASLLLARPGEVTPQFQRNHVSLAAHELAHQWFGNLVTMRWWDDLWLNESFASWLGDRITDELMPQWQWQLSLQQARARAMRTDRLASSRRVQQPVLTDDDMGSLWDSITYEKGQVVLAMFEQWLGPERFRDGVRRYMQKHAWGHASGDDFLAALATQDPALPAALRSFIAQPGLPRVTVALQCEGDTPRLQLGQGRLLALAGAAPGAAAAEAPLWQIPLQVRTPGGLTRVLLDQRTMTLPLPDRSCPAWVQANAGGQGYYRVNYAAPLRSPLWLQPGPTPGEILAGLDDAGGLSEAGDLPLAEALALAEHFARHDHPLVAEQALELMKQAQALLPAADEGRAAERWQRGFGERARRLGWQPQPGEDELQALLRPPLLRALAEHGADATLRRQAREQVQAWLGERGTLDASTRRAVLAAAALEGDEALFEALLGAARRAPDRTLRRDLYLALGHFRAPALAQRARTLAIDPALPFQEAGVAVLEAHNDQAALRDGLFQFIETQRDALVRRMGRDEPAWMPFYLEQACSDGEARRIERLFGAQAGRYAGGRRALAQVLERVRICAAWRGREAATLAATGAGS